MRRLGSFALRAAVIGLAVQATSCFAVTDLSRFDTRQLDTTNNDLRLSVRGMFSHVKEYFEVRIVDATNTIQSRAIITPLGGPDASVFIRGAVPTLNGPFSLDFYADHDSSGGYDTDPAAPKDHAWRIPLTQEMINDQGAYVISFDHNTSFSFLSRPVPPNEIGKPATVRLKNVGSLLGRRVEVRVADASSKRVVALYRIPVVVDPGAAGAVVMSVPGMIEEGVLYSIEVYTDDGQAGPGSAKSFRLESVSAAAGLDVELDPASAPVVTDAAAP